MITQTILPISELKVDFKPSLFEDLIIKKGRLVQHEKTLLCPCKSPSGGYLSNCQNCGGSGYLFVEPTKVKMIITNANIQLKLNELMVETRAIINITASDSVQLAYNDRLMLLDSISWNGEHLKFYKQSINGVLKVFARTFYSIKKIDKIALFVGPSVSLKILNKSDYTIDNNIIYLNDSFVSTYPNDIDMSESGLTGTIRYSHNPYYIITEMKRESFEQYITDTQTNIDQLKHLPIAAIGSKMHEAMPNLKIGKNLLNNTFGVNNEC